MGAVGGVIKEEGVERKKIVKLFSAPWYRARFESSLSLYYRRSSYTGAHA